jgi:hypothetical protein
VEFGLTWNDVPEVYRPILLRATREALLKPRLHHSLPELLKEVDWIQVPWREDDDIVVEPFLNVTRRFSKESERDLLARNESAMNEIKQLLDFCVSRIDHSMLSRIITK